LRNLIFTIITSNSVSNSIDSAIKVSEFSRMSNCSITLESVEAFIARRGRRLAFPAPIEQRFEADTRGRRCQRLTTGILVAAVLYNLYLIADWLLVPDVFWRAAAIHFGLVTPWMLVVARIISAGPSRMVREILAASLPVIIILQIGYGFAVTTSANAAHYQYVVIPTLLYTNVALHRLTFRFAVAVSAVIVLCHSTLALAQLSFEVAIMVLIHLVVCAYISLVANFQMERDLRRAYLYSLRDHLRHAEADATSRRDALTGLANRHHLNAEIARLWAMPEHDVSPISVVLLDLDHFKHLNDCYGHAAGDLCLKRVAAIVMAELRGADDHAVRYGGEELLLLLPKMELAHAMRMAERLRRAIEAAAIPNEGAGIRGVVTASFGVAASSVRDLSGVELIAAADSALYAAKRSGRNQIWPPRPTVGECLPGESTVAATPISLRQRA
jgi:diguanylate cyclase (GGDEF)-like protein